MSRKCSHFRQNFDEILTHFLTHFRRPFGRRNLTPKCVQLSTQVGVEVGALLRRPNGVAKHPLPDTPNGGVRKGTSDAFPTQSQPGPTGHPKRGCPEGVVGVSSSRSGGPVGQDTGLGARQASPWAGQDRTKNLRRARCRDVRYAHIATQACGLTIASR